MISDLLKETKKIKKRFCSNIWFDNLRHINQNYGNYDAYSTNSQIETNKSELNPNQLFNCDFVSFFRRFSNVKHEFSPSAKKYFNYFIIYCGNQILNTFLFTRTAMKGRLTK